MHFEELLTDLQNSTPYSATDLDELMEAVFGTESPNDTDTESLQGSAHHSDIESDIESPQ